MFSNRAFPTQLVKRLKRDKVCLSPHSFISFAAVPTDLCVFVEFKIRDSRAASDDYTNRFMLYTTVKSLIIPWWFYYLYWFYFDVRNKWEITWITIEHEFIHYTTISSHIRSFIFSNAAVSDAAFVNSSTHSHSRGTSAVWLAGFSKLVFCLETPAKLSFRYNLEGAIARSVFIFFSNYTLIKHVANF